MSEVPRKREDDPTRRQLDRLLRSAPSFLVCFQITTLRAIFAFFLEVPLSHTHTLGCIKSSNQKQKQSSSAVMKQSRSTLMKRRNQEIWATFAVMWSSSDQRNKSESDHTLYMECRASLEVDVPIAHSHFYAVCSFLPAPACPNSQNSIPKSIPLSF